MIQSNTPSACGTGKYRKRTDTKYPQHSKLEVAQGFNRSTKQTKLVDSKYRLNTKLGRSKPSGCVTRYRPDGYSSGCAPLAVMGIFARTFLADAVAAPPVPSAKSARARSHSGRSADPLALLRAERRAAKLKQQQEAAVAPAPVAVTAPAAPAAPTGASSSLAAAVVEAAPDDDDEARCVQAALLSVLNVPYLLCTLSCRCTCYTCYTHFP